MLSVSLARPSAVGCHTRTLHLSLAPPLQPTKQQRRDGAKIKGTQRYPRNITERRLSNHQYVGNQI